MRIKRLHLENWRQIEALNIEVPSGTNIVTLVGENGVGKSNVLELISECLMKLGIDQVAEPPRGYRLNEPHRLEMHLDFTDQLEAIRSTFAAESLQNDYRSKPFVDAWDGQLVIRSEKIEGPRYAKFEYDVGRNETHSDYLPSIFQTLSNENLLRHLHLDANRVFEREDSNWVYLLEQSSSDWTPALERLFAYRSSKDLFQQWQSWLTKTEINAGTRVLSRIRQSPEGANANERIVDLESQVPHQRYRELVHRALPHLNFLSAVPDRKSILYQSREKEIDFFALSGGEREICYVLGQIDRFNLENGILLIDEPELHLHPRLVSDWTIFLQSEVNKGQVWLATHSYEAVEATGLQNTFVFETQTDTRRTMVRGSAASDQQKRLFDLLGVPGLTLHGKTLLIVEGGSESEERNRYKQILQNTTSIEVLPQGDNKDTVKSAVATYRGLERLSGGTINVRGVIDSDFAVSLDERLSTGCEGVLALPVHEIENIFLYPNAMAKIANQNGVENFDWERTIGRDSDKLAGKWIFWNADHGRHHDWMTLLGDDKFVECRRRICQFTTSEISDGDGWLTSMGLPEEIRVQLIDSRDAYLGLRKHADWWRLLMGKPQLAMAPTHVNLANREALEFSVFRAWREDESTMPAEVTSIRNFVASTQ